MKRIISLILLAGLFFSLCGCGKAEPLEGIITQPASDKPKRQIYFCAPKEVDWVYVDTFHLIDGQWQSVGRYEIAQDESEMNEGVIHGTLKLALQEDLSVSYEFSYVGLHLFQSEGFDADVVNTSAVFPKESQYDIVIDIPIPVMLITDGAVEATVSDYYNTEKLSGCKMAQAIVLTFATEKDQVQ